MYENDFVDEKPVELNIKDRKGFMFKPTSGGDEENWTNDIIMFDPETKLSGIDWKIYNKKKLCNIVAIPYDKENIKIAIGVEKEWSDLTDDQKFMFLGKLKPILYDQIKNAIKEIDEADTKSLKN